MSSKILINAIDPEECRIAKVKDLKLEEFHIESSGRESIHGNIYKAVISRIEPSLQAVFVDFGADRHGFLQKHEIHSDYFQDNLSKNRSILKMVRRGQELLVQVTKDPFMKKGAMLTTYISLPGRYIVLMPGSDNRGISRKIEDEDERKRLKSIVGKLKLPEGFGIIVRTAGINSTKTQMTKDLNYLLRLWRNIKNSVTKVKAPVLLYKEQNLAVRSIRDHFTQDVTEILIDDDAVFHEVKDFVKIISPKHKKIVKLYRGDKPIFTKYQLEEQISSIYESHVKLKSGGTLVIAKKSIEQTALQTNIEASEEIARQLRLRDLGGLIVIDFIDMKDSKHKSEIERALKKYVKPDKAKTNISKISKFGLMEMSRQRIRPSIESSSFEPCRHCKGKGMIPSTEMLALDFLRRLRLETLKVDISKVKGIVPHSVADYLLNKKRKEILDLEIRRGLSITIEGNSEIIPGMGNIHCEK
ncbi:MAG: ribonuclease E/G [Desulfobacterales bacterium]